MNSVVNSAGGNFARYGSSSASSAPAGNPLSAKSLPSNIDVVRWYEAVKQRLVGPLEIQQQRDRVAHPHVLKNCATRVEHETLRALRGFLRERALDHQMPFATAGKS